MCSSLRLPLACPWSLTSYNKAGSRQIHSHCKAVSGPSLAKRCVTAQGVGKDAFQGWIDVSHLVSGGGKTKTAYDKLASLIGKDVHVDVNGWHLFLRDITVTQGIKMDQALAQAIGPDVSDRGYPDSDLEELLKKVPLELGKGKVKVPLFDAIPPTGFRNFSNAIKDYAKSL